MSERPIDEQLRDTSRAFDAVAAGYDGPSGNNALVQGMRRALWEAVASTFPPGARLLDLGCGTGLDAVHFARRGYEVLGIDSSPGMVARTRARAAEAGVGDRVHAERLGIEALGRLQGAAPFDGVYSDLGALNCVPDLAAVAAACAARLKPGGRAVLSVIGRLVPWEVAYYGARGQVRRALRRRARGPVPVGLGSGTVWTRYYAPRELARLFAAHFTIERYRALGLFLPPPYLIGIRDRFPAACALLGRLDELAGGLPLLRDGGDHFLAVLRLRG